MSTEQPKNPLHGITLKMIVEDLVERHGWEKLGEQIRIGCFLHEPSVKSSLKFLRKTPWARTKVEGLYLHDQRKIATREAKKARRAAAQPKVD